MSKKTAKTENTVVDEATQPEVVKLAEDAHGNTFLPELEPIVPVAIPDLIAQVTLIRKTLSPNFNIARDALNMGHTQLRELVHENLEHFTLLSDGSYEYKCHGVEINVKKEKEIITATLLDEDKKKKK